MKHGKWSVVIVLCLFPAYVVQAGDIPGGLLPGDFPDPRPAKVEKKATDGAGQQETKRRVEAERRAEQAEREKRALAEELARLKASQAKAASDPAPVIPRSGQVFYDQFKDGSGAGPEMVVIPEGRFTMGSPADETGRYKDEGPQHEVNVKAFALGRTEVTQGQWKAVMGSNPSHFKDCGDNCPVENVSWDDAKEFIQKLNAKTGKQYRLPTEAEWEYAARAGGKHEYSGSDKIGAVAWYDRNSGGRTHPVAQKQENAYGLYDVSGNVWEWVQDCYHDNYNGAPDDGSEWKGSCTNNGRVLRGGSWFYYASYSRAASRYLNSPGNRNIDLSFRLARTLP